MSDPVAGILAQLRHAYQHLAAEGVVKQKQFADGLLAPAIRRLEDFHFDDDIDDDFTLCDRFFDYGLFPCLMVALTLVAVLIASGALYGLIWLWTHILSMVGSTT